MMGKIIYILMFILNCILFINIFNFNSEVLNISFAIITSFILTSISTILILILFSFFLRFFKFNSKTLHFIVKRIVEFTFVFTRTRVKVIGRENLPNNKFVIISNHKSYMDIPILMSSINKNLSFVSKPGVFKVPVVGKYMHALNNVSIRRDNDRHAATDLITAIKNVKKGLNMCIFIEGGIKTLKTDKIIETKPGALKLALKSKADIIPVSIENAKEIKNRMPWRSTKVIVRIHHPMKYDFYSYYKTPQLAENIKNIVNSKLI